VLWEKMRKYQITNGEPEVPVTSGAMADADMEE